MLLKQNVCTRFTQFEGYQENGIMAKHVVNRGYTMSVVEPVENIEQNT